MKRTPKTRPPILEGPFDLAVVGGGINGAAIARDAALRGKTVILLEKDDFAAGTSSRSSKMLHGGIRYLEQLRLGLVYQALRERYHILRVAPHLARPQAFVIPIYQGAKRGPRMIRVGLFLYDFLALGKRLGKSRFLRAEEVLARVPHLLKQGLVGGGVYHDAVMDDARLCLLNAVAAYEEGQGEVGLVTVRNYAPVVEVRPGSPATVLVHDRLTGQNASVLAHRVVRALGPWTDPELLVRSKGVHLVLPAFPMSDGILLTHSKDGRVFFLIPWLQKTIVGTTETPFSGSLERLRVEPEEVKYLLDEVQRLFPEVHIGARHILGTCAGVRPLARSHGLFASKAPGSVSRAHRIVDDGNGVLSVFGGKFTTYRLVAKEVVDKLFPGSPCETHRRALPGGEGGPWGSFQQRLGPETSQLGSTELERLFYRYGTRLHELLRLIQEDPSLGERLAPPYPELRAEVVYSAQQEFAFYPEDFLARRTTLRYSDDGGRAAYDAVESLLRAHAPAVPPDLDEAREKYCAELDWEERLRGK